MDNSPVQLTDLRSLMQNLRVYKNEITWVK